MSAAASCINGDKDCSYDVLVDSFEETTLKLKPHMFSEPWEESDVTLVVEGERFHVHRMMLSMHSPVFRAMFKSDFREKEADEITLPGKKPEQILDLLNQIYPQQSENLTMKNVEHVLKLADEYQMKKIIKECGKFLQTEPKTKANAMDILLLAQTYGFSEVCDECHVPLAQLSFKELKGLEGFEMLDGGNTRKLLVPHLESAEMRIQAAEQNEKLYNSSVNGLMTKMELAQNEVEKFKRQLNESLESDKTHILHLKGMTECALYFALRDEKSHVKTKCLNHFDGSFHKRGLNWGSLWRCKCYGMLGEIGRVSRSISPSLNSAGGHLELFLT